MSSTKTALSKLDARRFADRALRYVIVSIVTVLIRRALTQYLLPKGMPVRSAASASKKRQAPLSITTTPAVRLDPRAVAALGEYFVNTATV